MPKATKSLPVKNTMKSQKIQAVQKNQQAQIKK